MHTTHDHIYIGYVCVNTAEPLSSLFSLCVTEMSHIL